MQRKAFKFKRGFSLIEIMVSLSVFIIVVTLVSSSIFYVINANSKSQNRKIAIDNVNFFLESMAKSIKFGSVYHCGGGDITVPANCSSGSNTFSFLDYTGARITYHNTTANTLTKVVNGTSVPLNDTNDIRIENMTFRVFGASTYGTDYLQPQVIITIRGRVTGGNKSSTGTTFIVQTTVSQRKLDI
jgi:prepilin-type N-terminal cleavage/methylation domain-containing protein